MRDGILWMNGIECWRPAAAHDFTTGLTYHVSRLARPCRIHPPRPIEEPSRR